MYDSMEQCLVLGKKGKGRQYGYSGRKRGNAAGHGQQEIRVRKDAGKRTVRGRRIGRTAWGLCMTAAIGGISFALAVQALAALGYSASDAMRAVKQAEGETAEELIKSALKHM